MLGSIFGSCHHKVSLNITPTADPEIVANKSFLEDIGWKSFTAMNVNSLRAHLNLDAGNKQADPKTRYV